MLLDPAKREDKPLRKEQNLILRLNIPFANRRPRYKDGEL